MDFERLVSFDEDDLRELAELMRQLSPWIVLTEARLREVLADSCVRVFVLRDGRRIVGTASLCMCNALSARSGGVEDVVVHSDWRGRGLGRELMSFLLGEARREGLKALHLTSKPERAAANRLYQSLGFRRKETNCYVMDL